MRKIIINLSILNVIDIRNCSMYLTIKSYNNCSRIYTAIDEEGENYDFTKNKVNNFVYANNYKKCDINLINETLELLKYKENDKIFTDDFINFIDEFEYNTLSDDYKKEFEKVEFIIE